MTEKGLEYAFKLAALFFVVITGLSGVLLFYVVEDHEAKRERYMKWKKVHLKE